jgi:hypothetical protein
LLFKNPEVRNQEPEQPCPVVISTSSFGILHFLFNYGGTENIEEHGDFCNSEGRIQNPKSKNTSTV